MKYNNNSNHFTEAVRRLMLQRLMRDLSQIMPTHKDVVVIHCCICDSYKEKEDQFPRWLSILKVGRTISTNLKKRNLNLEYVKTNIDCSNCASSKTFGTITMAVFKWIKI